jgi:hypothetical protein
LLATNHENLLKPYWSSNIEDQEEELLKGFEAIVVEGGSLLVLVREGVNYKGFVNVIAYTT